MTIGWALSDLASKLGRVMNGSELEFNNRSVRYENEMTRCQEYGVGHPMQSSLSLNSLTGEKWKRLGVKIRSVSDENEMTWRLQSESESAAQFSRLCSWL